MDKSLLRKAAIRSFGFMIAVIALTYALSHYDTIIIKTFGGSVIQTLAGDGTASSEHTDNSKSSDRSQTAMKQETLEIHSKLGNRYLMIKKPEGSHLALELEDRYMEQSIQLTMTGITAGSLTYDIISRVMKGKVYSGEPEAAKAKITEKAETEAVVTKAGEEAETEETENKGKADLSSDFCQGISITVNQDSITKQLSASIVLKLDKVYAYVIYEDANYYYIDLRKPSQVYKKVLVIDAGHGGKDCGALSKNSQYSEKNMNLSIVQELKKLLDKEDIKVYYTRTGDDTVFLRPRVKLANDVDCDYFISIHCNANKLSAPNGTEVLYYDRKVKGIKASKLAEIFSGQLGNAITLVNKGIVKMHDKDVYIMNKAEVPMVLIEAGYVTNDEDMHYLSLLQSRKAIARGIYNGIMEAYQELPVDKNNN